VLKLLWDAGFKKAYKNKVENSVRLKNKFEQAITLFVSNPYNPKLRTHKLSGVLDGSWSFSIDYDCRVIFDFIDEKTVLLIDIGTHDEVY
jgi:mRNA interferase YafQ